MYPLGYLLLSFCKEVSFHCFFLVLSFFLFYIIYSIYLSDTPILSLSIDTLIARIVEFGTENKAIKVACGDNFTVVLSQTGKIYSFGKGSHGRLGLGTGKLLNMGES